MANAGDATLATVGINVGPDDPDLEERLNAYGTIGYRALHIGISAFLIDDTSFDRFATIIAGSGLAPYSAHSAGMHATVTGDWQGADVIAAHEREFERCARLGARTLVHHIGRPQGLDGRHFFQFDTVLAAFGISLEAYVERNLELLAVLVDRARPYGIRLTLENLISGVFCDITNTPEQLLEFIERIGAADLGICFDSGHANLMGLDPYAFCSTAGASLIDTHLNDNVGAVVPCGRLEDDRHMPIGTGTIDWSRLVQGLRSIGFGYPVVFEVNAVGKLPEMAALSYAHWMRLLGETADADTLGVVV